MLQQLFAWSHVFIEYYLVDLADMLLACFCMRKQDLHGAMRYSVACQHCFALAPVRTCVQ